MAKLSTQYETAKPKTLVDGISIDSLKVRIPMYRVKVLDQSLPSDAWIAYNETTGETDPDYFKQNSLTKYIDPCQIVKVRFGIEQQGAKGRPTEEFLVILLSSKVAGERYLEGITIDNAPLVYEKVIGTGVASFTYETFIHESFCTDVDFKRDFICESFDKLVRRLYQSAKPSKKRDIGARSFNEKNNKGVEFNERKTQAYKTSPFMKVYQKSLELNTAKNIDFLHEYIGWQGVDPNLCRIETTIKNKKHFRQLGITDTSFFSLLTLTGEQKEGIIRKAVECNLEPRVVPLRTPKNMSINKLIHYNSITMLIHQGYSFDTVKECLLTGVDGKTNRYRKGRELEEIYAEHIQGEKYAQEAEELGRVYDLIGWS